MTFLLVDLFTGLVGVIFTHFLLFLVENRGINAFLAFLLLNSFWPHRFHCMTMFMWNLMTNLFLDGMTGLYIMALIFRYLSAVIMVMAMLMRSTDTVVWLSVCWLTFFLIDGLTLLNLFTVVLVDISTFWLIITMFLCHIMAFLLVFLLKMSTRILIRSNIQTTCQILT